MSYFNNIDYKIYRASGDDFSSMVDVLLGSIDEHIRALRLVFFCNILNSRDYSSKLNTLREKSGKFFKDNVPVISLVPQKPLDSDLLLEVHGYSSNEYEHISYKSFEGFSYVILRNEYGKFLYAGGLHSSLDDGIYSQSADVFRILGDIMRNEGFPVESIVRQWNYIGSITSFDANGNQHYQMFNNARSEFYSSSLWKNGYPAATGIGTSGNWVMIDVDAVTVDNPDLRIIPIDNKLQIAAHSYSRSVLEKADTGLTTPKFERAKSLDLKDKRLIYISGTAAIRGEKSIVYDVVDQLRITLENIRQLIGDSDIYMLRVYLKNEDDYDKVHDAMAGYCNIDVSYLLADVCRDELLIEIEGIAIDNE